MRLWSRAASSLALPRAFSELRGGVELSPLFLELQLRCAKSFRRPMARWLFFVTEAASVLNGGSCMPKLRDRHGSFSAKGLILEWDAVFGGFKILPMWMAATPLTESLFWSLVLSRSMLRWLFRIRSEEGRRWQQIHRQTVGAS